jgi:hypothetical protein
MVLYDSENLIARDNLVQAFNLAAK